MATLPDSPPLAAMRAALWPDTSAPEHERELVAILTGEKKPLMPLIMLVAESDSGDLLGFLEAGLRSCADGCEPWQPVGYVEGWYVAERYRKQ